jgi:hypothetical protein
MQGPKPSGTWTQKLEGRSYGYLRPGRVYDVRRAFVDYDGGLHPVGERWTYLTYNFLPYDDGLSLFVSLDGKQEWHIRLQDREGEQGGIVGELEKYIGEGAALPLSASDALQGLADKRPVDQLQALRAAVPRGTSAAAVEALFGAPEGRIDLSSSGPEATAWTYGPATCAVAGLKTGFAFDFDLHDKVVATE